MSSPHRWRPSAPASAEWSARWRFLRMLALDAVVPLIVYYAVRAFGASPWSALVAGAAVPLLRIVRAAATKRRVETTGWFTLSLLAAGTAVGMLAADPRLLMARESCLTGIAGLWILATMKARHPLVYTATIRILPVETAATWQRAWETSHEFRRVMRGMTLAFGLAFLVDAAARVVMAYTLPLDLVPVLSAALLVMLLIGVVQAGKAYGGRRLTEVLGTPPVARGDSSRGVTAERGSG